MPTEKELRDMLRGGNTPGGTLDARRIIARSRARRLPRQIAAGAAGTLVLASVGVLAVQVTQVTRPVTMTAGEAADSSGSAPEIESLKRLPVDQITLCADRLPEVAPSRYGLQLDVTSPASAAVGSQAVPVTVRLTNTSDREVVGMTATAPAITLSQDGVVLWHSNREAAIEVMSVDLVPGASVDYQTSMTPVRCGSGDDLTGVLPADLPPLEPGSYQLTALIDFTAGPSMQQQTTELDLVGGSRYTVALQ